MTDRPGTRTRPARTVITGLVVVHFLAGIMLGALAQNPDRPRICAAAFISLIASQAGLVGCWASLGQAPWGLQLLGLIAGLVCLGCEFAVGVGDLELELFFFVSVIAAVVAAAFWTLRRFKVQTVRIGEDSFGLEEGLKFTIRQLMMLTLAVACVVTAGKALSPYVPDTETLAEISVVGLCFVAITVTAVWAVLGLARPAARCIAVILIAVIAGFAAQSASPETPSSFWVYAMFFAAAYVLASLLVIRSLGYRVTVKRA